MTLAVYPDRFRRDIAAAVQNAATGGKRDAGYSVVTARFPSGSTLRLIRDAVTVFQCTTTAQPMVVDGRLRLSKVYGAATVLSNADKDSGAWTWTLTNGDNRITGTLGPYALTGDLSTSKGLSIGDVYLTIDPAIDAQAGSVIASVEDYITQMTAANAPSQSFSGMGWANNPGQGLCPSGVALADMTSGGRGDICTYGNGVDSIIAWHWADRAAGHASSSSELQHRSTEAFCLLGNDWTRLWGPTTLGSGYRWNNGGNGGNTNIDISAINRGGGVSAYPQEIETYGQELWPLGHNPAVNPSLVRNSVAIHVRGLFRVGVRPGGADTRSSARYRAKIGFDEANSTHYNFPGGSAGPGKPFSGPEKGTYPGYYMNGFGSSWIPIPFNPANPDAWYMVSVTSITPCFYVAGSVDPWLSAGITGEFPWAKEPWCLTHNQLRNNPPPLPV